MSPLPPPPPRQERREAGGSRRGDSARAAGFEAIAREYRGLSPRNGPAERYRLADDPDAASRLVVVTDREQAVAAGRPLLGAVTRAIDGGARTVLLREKDLPRATRARLAERIQQLLQPVGGALLVASDMKLAASVGAAGVHLAAGDPPVDVAVPDRRSAVDRPGAADSRLVAGADSGPLLVGRSCHSVEELVAADAEGCDYFTLSPIWVTASKPGYGPALGLEGLAAACAKLPELPVVALGGVVPERVADCLAAGAAGVAVMGAIMRADDPALVVGRILEASAG